MNDSNVDYLRPRKCDVIACRGDEGANFLKNRQQMKMSELDEQLAEYIAEWRKQRQKEEDELNKLKDKQAKRKVGFRSFKSKQINGGFCSLKFIFILRQKL